MTPSVQLPPREAARPGHVVLPTSVLSHLKQALRRETGVLSATHVLQDAGFAAGDRIYDEFAREVGGDPSELGASNFWEALDRYLARRGWGHLRVERVHSGLGILHASDWAESDPGSGDGQPGCYFSSGLLAHLLGQAAGGPVAVLEVECRSRGDDGCRFLYGSEAAVHEIYGLLLDGVSLDEALVEL
jgi:hypothetical protein